MYNELSQTQECGVTNQIAPFAIKSLLFLYSRIINVVLCGFFFLELVLDQHRRSADLLEKCVRQRRQNDRRTDGKQKEDSSERKKLTVVSNSNERLLKF